MPTLQYRKHRGDMIAVYSILHGSFDMDFSDFLHLQIIPTKLEDMDSSFKEAF